MKKFYILVIGLCLNSIDAATTCTASNNAGLQSGGINIYGSQPHIMPGMMLPGIANSGMLLQGRDGLCSPGMLPFGQSQNMGQGQMLPIMQPNIASGAMPYQQGFNLNNQQGAGQWGQVGYPSNTNQGGAPTQCQPGQQFGNSAFGQPGWGIPGMGASGLFMPGGATGVGQPGMIGPGMTQPGAVSRICQAGMTPGIAPSGFTPGAVQPALISGVGGNSNNNTLNNIPSNGQCECAPVQPGSVQGFNQPISGSQPLAVNPVVLPNNVVAAVPTAHEVDYGQSIVLQSKADAENSVNQARAEAQAAAQKAKADTAVQVASTQKNATAAAANATNGVFSSAMSSIGSIFKKK